MNDKDISLLQPEQEQRIAAWLQKLKFRRRIFGGVSEKDVWKKISELNDLYHEALIAQRARYDTLLKGDSDPMPKAGDPK